MSSIRNRIEKWFEKLAYSICRHRILTIVVMLGLSALLISRLPGITIDTSTEGFLHENDPTLVAYNEFLDQFGKDEVVIVAVESNKVFDQKFLRKLKALHKDPRG